MISNILAVSIFFSSIIIIVSGLYYYPLDDHMRYFNYLIGACILTSILNHWTKNNKRKKFFQIVDRIIIRLFCLYLIIISKNVVGSDILLFKKYNTTSRNFILYGLIFSSSLYILTRILKLKKTNYPTNIIKIPHAIAHMVSSVCLLFIFMEFTTY